MKATKFLADTSSRAAWTGRTTGAPSTGTSAASACRWPGAEPGDRLLRPRLLPERPRAGYNRQDPPTWVPAVPLTSMPDTLNTAFFAQDSWRFARNATINAGVRWERQQINNRDGATVIDLKTNWASRLGFVWDFARNGRSKVFAGYGRFYESIPLDIDIRSFGGEVSCSCFNFDPDPHDFTPDPAAPRPSRVNSSTEPVDPNLRGQYINEFVGGAEYEVAPNVTVGVKYVHRDLARDRRFPDPVRVHLFHRQSRPGARQDDGVLLRPFGLRPRERRHGGRAQGEAHERQHRDHGPEEFHGQLAAPRQLRMVEARRQLRRDLSKLHGAAGSEHQLGLRLRGLHGERRGEADQRSRASAQAGCQLRVLEGPAQGAESRAVDALVLGMPLTAYGFSQVYGGGDTT